MSTEVPSNKVEIAFLSEPGAADPRLRISSKPIRFHRPWCWMTKPFKMAHPGMAATCTCGADPNQSPAARIERGELFPTHPLEGRVLYPYTVALSPQAVRLEWFEALEALVTYHPEFAEHPEVRFVVPTTNHLHVTAPLEDRPLGARGLRWHPAALVWCRPSFSVASRPRRTDDGSIKVFDRRLDFVIEQLPRHQPGTRR